MALEVHPGSVAGVIAAPPSKSETHRALLIAALAAEPVTLERPLVAGDTRATLAAITALGATVAVEAQRVVVRPTPLGGGEIRVDCANSGTTLRLVAGIAAARPGTTWLDGDPSLRTRPMAPLLAALREAGVAVESSAGRAPLSVRGPLRSRRLRIDARMSSQFVSSLVLALVADGGGGEVVIDGLVSAPYLEMTLRALGRAGVEVGREPAAGAPRLLRVPSARRPRGGPITIPGDWSSAAFALVAGALAGRVRVEGLPPAADQADGALLAHLERMGAILSGPQAPSSGSTSPSSWVESERAPLGGIAVDLAGSPDLFPVLAVALAGATGRSELGGAAHLRAKETDRIALVSRNLRAQGVQVQEHRDGISLPGGEALAGGPIESGGDHRILMAFAVGATVARSPVTLVDADPEAVAGVSYPGFFADLARLGVRLVAR